MVSARTCSYIPRPRGPWSFDPCPPRSPPSSAPAPRVTYDDVRGIQEEGPLPCVSHLRVCVYIPKLASLCAHDLFSSAAGRLSSLTVSCASDRSTSPSDARRQGTPTTSLAQVRSCYILLRRSICSLSRGAWITHSQYSYVSDEPSYHAIKLIPWVRTVLRRIYGDEFAKHKNYSTTLSSLAFAGTVVGMLLFGYLSDKMGRKFGMVSSPVSY